jgi:hypothetical protein
MIMIVWDLPKLEKSGSITVCAELWNMVNTLGKVNRKIREVVRRPS